MFRKTVLVVVFILCTGCMKDYDFNPFTTTLRIIHDNSRD